MCSECGQTPCVTRCPNFEDKIISRCPVCRDEVLEGEECAEIKDEIYHLECLANMDFKEVLKLMNIEVNKEK